MLAWADASPRWPGFCPNFAFDCLRDASAVVSSSSPSFPWLDSASSLPNCLHMLNMMPLAVPWGQRIWLKTQLRSGRIRGCTMRFPNVQHHPQKRVQPGDLWLLVHTQMINCKETSQPLPALLLTLLFGFFGCRSQSVSRTSMHMWTHWLTCTPTRSATRTRKTRTCWRASSKPSRASRFSAVGWRRANRQTVRWNFPSKYSGLQVRKLV